MVLKNTSLKDLDSAYALQSFYPQVIHSQ